MTLHHDRIGAGPRHVLLIHGFLGSAANLRRVARLWGERDASLSIWLVDLPGHGASPPLPASPTLADLAEPLLAFKRQLATTQPIDVVGHSLGGRAALKLAMLDRSAVGAVTLLDITPSATAENTGTAEVLSALLAAPDRVERREEMRAAFVAQGLSDKIADWLAMNVVRDPAGGYTFRFDRSKLAALRQSDREDLWPVLDEADHPVRLCIRGERSSYVTPADSARLEARGCRVVTLPGAGHWVHADAPEALVELLAAPAAPVA